MKKFFSSVMLAVLFLLAGGLTAAAQNEAPTLYGYLYYSDAWTDSGAPVPDYAFYSIPADGSTSALTRQGTASGTFQELSNSGVYAKGKYYGVDIVGGYLNYTTTWRVYDPETWKLERSVEVGKKLEETVSADLTYDPIEDKIYAVTRPFGNTEKGWLATVDPETGQFTRLCETHYLCAVAADATGQLWGIDAKGNLCKTQKDGSYQVIGATGFVPNDLPQSGTIDFRTGKFYWAFKGFTAADTWKEDSYSYIFEVDLATGKATPIVTFTRQEQLTALAIINAHPSAPDQLSDLTFAPSAPGSMKGRVAFTVPSRTYGGTPLTGTVQISISVDGKEPIAATAQAGSQFEAEVDADAGNHTVIVILEQGGYESVKNKATAYFGYDAPAPVTGLTLSVDESRATATLTWTPPTKGENGGFIDTDNLTYDIVRLPSGAVAASGLSPRATFVETVPDEMENIRYSVTVNCGGQKSKAAYSNYATVGTPCHIPYIETFDTQHSFDAYTVIDANADCTGDDFYQPRWKFDTQYYCAFYYTNIYGAADDWLITPALAFDANKVYRLTFQAYGYYGYDNNLAVTIGPGYTVAGQNRVIKQTTFQAPQLEPVEINVDFVPAPGDAYIGFHVTTAASEHTSIDNLYLRELSSASVPATVEQLTAEKVSDSSVRLSFTTPSLTAMGTPLDAPLEARIYKSGSAEPAGVVKNLGTAAQAEWTDTQAAMAVNTYEVAVANGDGESIRAIVACDLSIGVPQPASDLQAVRNANGGVQLTWQASPSGTDSEGRYVNSDDVRYRVTRITDDAFTVIAPGVKGTAFTDATPEAELDGTQGIVRYMLTPFTQTGEAASAYSGTVIVGADYALPFAETWFNQQTATNPWRNDCTYSTWTVVGTGYDPFTIGQDGPGLITFSGDEVYNREGEGVFISPRIDFSETVAPQLSFYLFHTDTYADDTYMRIGYETPEGQRTFIPTTFSPKGAGGWTKHTVDLSALQGLRGVSILIYGHIRQVANNNIHVDNLTISGTAATCEAVMESLEGHTVAEAGFDYTYTARVKNAGTADFGQATVELYEGEKLIDSSVIKPFAAGETKLVKFVFTPADNLAGQSVTLTARVFANGDQMSSNNAASRLVSIEAPNLPRPSSLTGISTSEKVELSWTKADASDVAAYVVDGAEDYPDFSISDFGLWTLFDGDEVEPFKFGNATDGTFSWPNDDMPQAFMAFNPSKVSATVPLTTYEGDRCFISWAAYNAPNNDWLISPCLSGNRQTVSFFAQSVTSEAEPYQFLYSTTGNAPEDFRLVAALEAADTWTEQRFALPEDARYFALRYVGLNKTGLMLDNISYEGCLVKRSPDGFNVYRDGVRLNDAPVDGYAYTDTAEEGTSHVYTVTAVYGSRESQPSPAFSIVVNGISSLNAAPAALAIRSARGGIVIADAPSGVPVTVYAADGRAAATAITDGRAAQFLPLPAGIYVVRAGSQTAKALVR